MKAKVIDSKLDNCGQIVDVVLNKYLGKYTDGVKTYPKNSLSFDEAGDETSQEDKDLVEHAFRILLSKECTSELILKSEEDVSKTIDYSFGVAKLFQHYTRAVLEQERLNREAGEQPQKIVIDTDAASEELKPVGTEEPAPKEKKETNDEIGLSDLQKELTD